MHQSKARLKILNETNFQSSATNNKGKPGLFVWQMSVFRRCAVIQVSEKAEKSFGCAYRSALPTPNPAFQWAGGSSPPRQFQHFMIGKLHKKKLRSKFERVQAQLANFQPATTLCIFSPLLSRCECVA